MKLAFSVLTYRPSFIADEKINVGVLFHNTENNDVYFELTTNWSRIKVFDDEIDINIFKILLNGMKTHSERLLKESTLEHYIKRYNNELRFGEVFYKNTEFIEDFILESKQMFMPQDFEKNKRPTEKKQLSYMKNVLKDSCVKYKTKSIKGNFNENINYDYTINNYGFKLFEFQDKNPQNLVATAKHWAYTAQEMIATYETIFMYDIKLDSDIFNSIMKILSSSGARVMQKEEALEFTMQFKANKSNQFEFKVN